jgi:hypothetical protein
MGKGEKLLASVCACKLTKAEIQHTRRKSETGAKSIAGGRLVPQHTRGKSETGAKSIAGGRL